MSDEWKGQIHFVKIGFGHFSIVMIWPNDCMPRRGMGVFPKNEGGMQVLEGLAPSSQTAGSLLRTPWLAKSARRMIWAKLQLQIFIYLQTYFYFLTNSLKRKLFTKNSTTSFLYFKNTENSLWLVFLFFYKVWFYHTI